MTTRKRKSPASGEPVGDKAGSLEGGAGVRSRAPVPEGKWVAVAFDDVKEIVKTCADHAPVVLAIWVRLLREAYFKHSYCVRLTDAQIALDVGVDARTIRRRRNELAETKICKIEPPSYDATAGRFRPTLYRIKPSRKPWVDRKGGDNLTAADNMAAADNSRALSCPRFLQSSIPPAASASPTGDMDDLANTSDRPNAQTGGRAGAAAGCGPAVEDREDNKDLAELRRWQAEEYQ